MADSVGALKDLMIITGFSGAGKSTAMNVFEDAGYFCVDNLPPGMIGSLIELFVHEGSKVERAAVVTEIAPNSVQCREPPSWTRSRAIRTLACWC